MSSLPPPPPQQSGRPKPKPIWRRWWVWVITGVVALGAIGALTDASEEAATRKYFIELKGIAQDAKARMSQRTQEAREAFASAESAEELDELAFAYVEDVLAITRSVLATLKELSPPEMVVDQHAAFVDAYAAQLQAMQRLVEDYKELGFERFAARFKQEFRELTQGTHEACVDLQPVAEDVNVYLGC